MGSNLGMNKTMTDTSKPEGLEDKDLDAVQGGNMNIEIGMAVTGDRKSALLFDEADAVKRGPDGNRIVAQGGTGNI